VPIAVIMADGIDDVAVVIVMEWESCCGCCVFGCRGVVVQRKPVVAGRRDNGAAGCYCCCQSPSCLHSNLLLTNFLQTSHHWILPSFIGQESTSKCQAASNLEKRRGSTPLVSRQIASAAACVLDDACHGIHLPGDACRAHAARNAKRPCVCVLDEDGTALAFRVTSVEA